MTRLSIGIAVAAAALMAGPSTAQQSNAPAEQHNPQASGQSQGGPAAPNVTPSRRDEPGSSSATKDQPPIPGANSFTESQARERISKSGYTGVKDLQKDNEGIWRGQAQKDGKQVNVALDYRGNIVQQ
jgi:hypothetical protein